MKNYIALLLLTLLLSGCGSLNVYRDCTKAEDRQEWVCKSLGFWE
jgi:PBP1b-binding outer membrane lipoprotein LpoB